MALNILYQRWLISSVMRSTPHGFHHEMGHIL